MEQSRLPPAPLPQIPEQKSCPCKTNALLRGTSSQREEVGLDEDPWDRGSASVLVQEGCLWNETRCDLHELECGRFTEQTVFQPCMKAPEQLLHISGENNRQARW